jgi:hypothetical protein
MTRNSEARPTIQLALTDDDVFLLADGVEIARRENKGWTVLEPGWSVSMSPDYERISISYDPVRVH